MKLEFVRWDNRGNRVFSNGVLNAEYVLYHTYKGDTRRWEEINTITGRTRMTIGNDTPCGMQLNDAFNEWRGKKSVDKTDTAGKVPKSKSSSKPATTRNRKNGDQRPAASAKPAESRGNSPLLRTPVGRKRKPRPAREVLPSPAGGAIPTS